ncbi:MULTISPECIES: 50S ribosomal protein L9 [unclassified Hydrogenobaculum]|uniref:50S ribosomal protein L9 n=1 Tax=unclassified Hydrogenobaculum TaxID=2622382 RepID=UPI0001C5035A|nr:MULTISPECIES: 50S ribosomal protein L9 [unclassified Hydrogenobaculum]AEF18840.1 ribosomal protein L9 [Hydrogenobaculum sp. 3684]AEG46128.1 50S ribosomal protein L9 [Hydrogenobaculum sp. SHO]AGG14773.1 ribosomal protein L9 [Hydrogenobaculum sp. HO]AGH93070.1 ribosomal protein L9 [Hydrogenobaculum sp. SN]
MKVILLEELEGRGSFGDIITVRDGFANNYLIPRKLALPATEGNIKHIQSILSQKARKLEKIRAQAQELAKKLDGAEITIRKPVGQNGKLFGAITTSDIAKALNEKGFNVDKKQIIISSPIKNLGLYTVKVRLHNDIYASVKVNVQEESK